MKRTVSLLLAVVLILSLAVGALAADATAASRFTDWEDIDHQPEVAMLTDLGLLSGYADGSFRPYNCITRAEIAKIISSLLTDQVPEAKTDRFTDTGSNWARNYIEYCADQGILAGAGASGLFWRFFGWIRWWWSRTPCSGWKNIRCRRITWNIFRLEGR